MFEATAFGIRQRLSFKLLTLRGCDYSASRQSSSTVVISTFKC